MNHRAAAVAAQVLSLIIVSGCATQSAPPPAPAPAAAPVVVSPADQISVAAPVIPDRTYNLADFGGVGDGKTYNTLAFRKAVATIAIAGGGKLFVPAGVYLTKPFILTNHLELHLEVGATIQASSQFSDYDIRDPNLPATQPSAGLTNEGFVPGGRRGTTRGTSRPSTRDYRATNGIAGQRMRRLPRLPALISADGKTDIAITGAGTIDGAGRIFWAWSDKAARLYPPGRNVVPRPGLLNISNAKRVHIDGVTFSNSPEAHMTVRGNDLLIENVRVVAPSDAPNSDAMRITGENVIIRKCEIDTGDDDVAIGTPTHNMLIEDMTILHGHGISVGSFTEFGLDHVFVRRATFDGTDNGLRIKSFRGGGGQVHDIWYSDISMKNVRRPFDVNCRYNGNANVTSDVGPREAVDDSGERMPDFYDLHVSNLTVTRAPIAGRIIGIPECPAERITFTNCKFDTVRGFYVEDAKDIKFENVQIDAAVGEQIVTKNAEVMLNGAVKTGAGKSEPFYWGD